MKKLKSVKNKFKGGRTLGIRQAQIQDINEIMNLIKAAIIDMQLQGIDQWDQSYPNQEIIVDDINESTLYVFTEKDNIKAIIVLNEFQNEEYNRIQWQYKEAPLVVHRLCVHPQFQGNGIAKKLLTFAENYARENGYESIRLDTFTLNKGAVHLYEANHYEKRGIVHFPKGKFYCFEKRVVPLL